MIYPLVISPFDDSDIQTLIETIKSRQFTMGPLVKKFETEFAEKMGSRYAVMVNSGSSANLAATFSLLYKKSNPLKKNCEVLVPAIGWSTTWAPLQQAGFRIKIVDVNPETLNVDVESYREAISENTKMIVTVSILGNPLDFENLKKLCQEKNILLFEDNCESIGATVNGKSCGTFGDVGTFSFFYSHHISTIEGGMIVTDDEELYHLCLSLRAHGWARDIPNENYFEKIKSNELRENYNFVVPGFNLRPLEMSGALGLTQLQKLDALVAKRRENALLFAKTMQKHDGYFIQLEKFGKSSWYSFPIILKKGTEEKRNRLFEHLKKNGIESRMVTGGCLTLHPMKEYFDIVEHKRPINAERIHSLGLFVANHSVDMSGMFEALDNALTSFETLNET